MQWQRIYKMLSVGQAVLLKNIRKLAESYAIYRQVRAECFWRKFLSFYFLVFMIRKNCRIKKQSNRSILYLKCTPKIWKSFINDSFSKSSWFWVHVYTFRTKIHKWLCYSFLLVLYDTILLFYLKTFHSSLSFK